jgi:hypothetical protein
MLHDKRSYGPLKERWSKGNRTRGGPLEAAHQNLLVLAKDSAQGAMPRTVIHVYPTAALFSFLYF